MNNEYERMIMLCAESEGGAVLRSIDGKQYIAAHVNRDAGSVTAGDKLVLFIQHDPDYNRDSYVLSPYDEDFEDAPEYEAVTDEVLDIFTPIVVARALNGN